MRFPLLMMTVLSDAVQSLRAPREDVGCRTATRRELCAISALPLLASGSSQPAVALEGGLLPGELDFFIDPLQYAARKRTQQQKECYEADACADAVPYWDLVCSRDDSECLARKRRLAASEWQGFFSNPTSSPLLLFLAVAVSVQWGSAITRTAASIVQKYSDGSDSGDGDQRTSDDDDS